MLQSSAKSPQSCPTLCDPIDGSPPRSPVPGILQARILAWKVGCGLPFPSPGDLPDPAIEPGSPALRVDSLPFEPSGKPEGSGMALKLSDCNPWNLHMLPYSAKKSLKI